MEMKIESLDSEEKLNHFLGRPVLELPLLAIHKDCYHSTPLALGKRLDIVHYIEFDFILSNSTLNFNFCLLTLLTKGIIIRA